MNLSKLLHVFLALCHQRPSLSLTKTLKLIDWLDALNTVKRLQLLGSVVPLEMFAFVKAAAWDEFFYFTKAAKVLLFKYLATADLAFNCFPSPPL